jgi:hypothetical protein
VISKSLAMGILEKEFNFSLTGPFGYIDIGNIRKRYGGCPLKLKMKIGKEVDQQKQSLAVSSFYLLASTSFDLETPKSPKSFHI